MTDENDLIRRGDAALAVLQNFTETAQLEAINTIPAAQVTVKQLEWHKSIIEAWNEDWHTVPTGYTVRCADENGWKWSTSGAFGYEYSPESAKAAAQADYDARILSALEWKTIVSPEVQALVEAVQESQVQIAYLHERLGESTGSGNAVMARNTAALAALKEITK